MMLLNDVFTALSVGELSNLAMSNNGNGTINPLSQPKLVTYANEALLRLYTRFVLKETDVLVQLYEHITFYHLLPKFSVSYTPTGPTDDQPIRYLLDNATEPFEDDLIKVLSVYNSFGQQLPLNDEEKHNSVFTPKGKLLQVPAPQNETYLSVRYQQRHLKLTGNLEENVYLPDILFVALTAYIAYKVFSHMNTPASNAKAVEFNTAYEEVCNEVVDRDLVSSSISQSNTRFAKGGWR